MKSNRLMFAALGVAVSCVCSSFGDVVYVKPEACGMGDGSNWENAMGSVSNALVQALKTPAPHEVRMAKGIHDWVGGIWIGRDMKGELDPEISGGYPFSIRGGYAGESTDETPDNEANPTYLNFDVLHNDRWVKRDLTKAFYNGQNATTDLGPIIDGNGNVVIPDEVGENEMVHPDSGANLLNDNAIFMSLVDNGANNEVVLSDFTIIGAGKANPYKAHNVAKTQATGSFIDLTAAALVMKNITFLGCYFPGTVASFANSKGTAKNGVVTAYKEVLDNVTFRNIYAGSRLVAIGGCDYGIFRHVTMKEIYFPTATQSGTAFYFRNGTGGVVDSCLFEKCYATSSSGTFGPSTVTGMEQGQGHLYTNCVYRNNWAKGPNMTSALNFRSTSANGAIQIRVADCLFESNKTYTTASSGKLYNLGTVELGMNDNALIGCTFRDNLSVVKPTGTCSSSHASTVTISSIPSKATTTDPRRTVVNCTFSGNRIEVDTGSTEVEKVFSRSILVDSLFAENPLDVVIAGCTFADKTSALPDVCWTGSDTTYPVSVINSFFLGDAANGYVPFVSDAADMIEADNCLMNGCESLPANVKGDANVFAELPVGTWDDLDGTRAAAVIRPAANVPVLRTALPLSWTIVNEETKNPSTTIRNAFYPLDTDGTALYRTATAVIPFVEPLADAVGDVRPSDAVTIGAVQALTDEAENGATLYVNVNPKGAGTLSGGGAIQVVERGAGIVEITAVSSDPARYTFEGWKLPDGTVYSDLATLTISSLDDNLQLTASFSAPRVTYTFDLGVAGTFDETGASTAVLELSPGDKLTVPAFTIDEEKVVPYGWDVTPPATVGTDSATFTYQYLEKIYRVVRFDAQAFGTGDGTSWANAMTNLQAAIDLAGAWKGEVWIRQGAHLVARTILDTVTMKSNVQILGGFEGVDGKYDDVDAERAARDPEVFRSALTGDIGLDDIWMRNGVELRDETNGFVRVVADGQMQLPAFEVGQVYYGHKANTANAEYIFDNTDAVLDKTAVLDGVTLTGAKFGVYNGASAKPTIRNCTFVGAPKCMAAALLFCDGCSFIANNSEVYDEAVVMRCNGGTEAGEHSIIRDCTFKYCNGQGRGIFVFSDQQGFFEMKGCRFEQCTGWVGLSKFVGTLIGAEWGRGIICETTVTGCWNTSGTWLVAVPTYAAVVSNCLFESNSVVQNKKGDATGTGDVPSAILGQTNEGGTLKVVGCTFRDNVVDRTVGDHTSSKNGQATVVYLKASGENTFVNCTFDNNAVRCASNKAGVDPRASVALVRDWWKDASTPNCARASVVNCTFNNNVAADGDIYLADRIATTPVYLVNTICWGGEGHKAVTASGAGNAEVYLWNSIAHGTDLASGFIVEAVDCATTSPGRMRKWVGEAPVLGKMPGSNSAAHNGGRNVYVDANGVFCVPSDAEESAFVNAATGAAVTPTGELTMLTDVFGEARPAGGVTIGAVQACKADGLMMLVR